MSVNSATASSRTYTDHHTHLQAKHASEKKVSKATAKETTLNKEAAKHPEQESFPHPQEAEVTAAKISDNVAARYIAAGNFPA